MKQRNRINLLIIIFAVIGFLCIFLFPLTAHCQQGMKGSYTTKKVVTIESLTKGCTEFDTFVETGSKVYYKQVTKKDGTKEDYYFMIVEKQRKDGSKYLGKKRIYPVFTSK